MIQVLVLFTLTTLSALPALSALPDKGIFPEYDDKVHIAAPGWALSTGAAWLRVDATHGVLTVYQGPAPMTAYPIAADSAAAVHTVADALARLPADQAAEVRRRVPPDARVRAEVPSPAEDRDGDGIVDSLDILIGAKRLCLNQAAYKENYRALKYPMGDVPRGEGVCTDTIVRALRNAGWDLQREIHEDLARAQRVYPLEQNKQPDANIDHRRVRMMVPWFLRHFLAVEKDQPMRPGDIVFLDTFPSKPGPDHVGILSDRLGPSGKPLVINNWTNGYVEQEMDLLSFVPVTHRFRAPMGQPVLAR